MTPRPRFIGSEIYRYSRYGASHPLSIPRVSACIDLCRALGWLADDVYVDSPRATVEQLVRFHAPDYLDALMAAEADPRLSPGVSARYHIGINGNPVFPEIFRRPATACGGTLKAVELVKEGVPIVYNPAGGTHHGRPDRASGFCYLNDPALGIQALLDAGFERVLYLDIDAHHCDGVADAFAGEPRVLMISVHEAGRWPNTGPLEERAGGSARNLPVPPDFNDSELAYLLEEAILPVAARFRPRVVMMQGGCDALADDPLSKLGLSNNAHWRAVRAAKDLAPHLIMLGGGGYNPWAVARCWSGAWGVLNGYDIPERLPAEAERVLQELTWKRSQGRNPPRHWRTTLADPPRHGPIRSEIRDIAAATLRD
jgi:acetoin utilization protein AcuC